MALCAFCKRPVAVRFVLLADGSLCHPTCRESLADAEEERTTHADGDLEEPDGIESARVGVPAPDE